VAPVLEIENLHTDIKLRQGTVHPVDGVYLHVEPGETLGIVGESGCGKTMTALSIMGLLPVGGSIAEAEGERLLEQIRDTIRGNEIGMIFQDPLTSLNRR
jgi:peptide/nickel transport system ATP-binding protein